jgi:hypothetical protein
VTWRVKRLFFGFCRPDAEALRVAATELATSITARELSPDEVFVTGLPAGATTADVREVFARFLPLEVRLSDTRMGSATVRFPTGTDVASVITATHRVAVVLGAVVNVSHAERTVTIGGGPPAGGATGGAGGAAGAFPGGATGGGGGATTASGGGGGGGGAASGWG